MGVKKAPESGDTLSRGNYRSGERVNSLTVKLSKYARLKAVNCQIGAILGIETGDTKLEQKLAACGRFLIFREYLFSGQVKLHSGSYCNMHMLCPCCAAARSRRMLARWLPVVFDSRHQDRVRHYLLTLTWPPPRVPLAVAAGPEAEKYLLRRNLDVGIKAWGKLWKRRKNRSTGPLNAVLGAILATEVTQGPAGWHPHFHILVTLPRKCRINAADLRQDWCTLTGGRQIRLDPLVRESDVVEVFKYAVKPADLDKQGGVDRAGVMIRHQVWSSLRGARLIRGFGGYYNVEEEDLTQPETVEDIGDWLELVFQWMGKSYDLVREIPSGQERGKSDVSAIRDLS